MLFRTAIFLFILYSFGSCSKDDIARPYGYLNLKLDGHDDDVRWETITATWENSSGKADLEAASYYFDQCAIHLENIKTTGAIFPVTIKQFYFTDGLDFRPHALSGSVTITEASDKVIKGTFDLHFENNYNGAHDQSVTGDFGIINRQ